MEISAVIPCYNGEKFLEQAVASINNQTYLPKEIVIVNDGSTDGSESTIERLKATSRVKIKSVNQVNRGVSAARNVGIAHASYDWVAFLDVDDIWLPTMLESKVNYVCQQDTSVGVICCNYYVDRIDESCKKHNGSENARKAHDRVMTGSDFQALILKENFIGTATTMMFSRQLALQIGGFDSFMKHSEEFDFILRIACIAKVAVLSEPLALKFHHGENLSDDKELYFYSHYFSCKKNLMYEKEYTKVFFNEKIRRLMRRDLENFVIGYCNQVYEKNQIRGLLYYIRHFFDVRTIDGHKSYSFSFLKKILRTASFNFIKKKNVA